MHSSAGTQGGFFHGWWLVGAGFLLQGVATAAVSYSYGLVLAPLAAEFSATRLEMMLGITACTLVGGVISPFLGVAIDRYSLRALACIGIVLLASGFFWLSLTSAMWQVTLAYALCMSVVMILMGPVLVSTMLARWFSRRRGLAMGIAALGTSACGFVLPPLLQWGIDGWGWREAYRVFAATSALVMLPLVWLLVEDSPAHRGLQPDGDAAKPEAALATSLPSAAGSTAEILRRPEFWLVALVVGVLMSVYSALLSNLAPLATGRAASAETAAYLISTVAVFGILGKLVFGMLADRIDLRAGLAAALALIIVTLVLLIHGSNHPMLFVASAVLGLAAGGMLPVWGALMAVLFGATNYGRVMGLMNPVMMAIVITGSPFAGWSYDATGDYAQAFWTFTAFCVLALMALARVRLPH